jgi:hypothetical protein
MTCCHIPIDSGYAPYRYYTIEVEHCCHPLCSLRRYHRVWDGDLLLAPALYLYTLLRRVFLSYFHQLHDLKDVTRARWWHAAHLRSLDPRLRMHSNSTHAFAWLASSPTLRSLAISHKAKLLSVAQAPRA